jgi:hypothetical protein
MCRRKLGLAIALLWSCGASPLSLAGQHGQAVITSKQRAITFVAIDGRRLQSPQREIKVSSGYHQITLSVNTLLLGYKFPGPPDADAPLDDTFEADHHYTVEMQLSADGRGTLIREDLNKARRAR